MCHTTRSEQEAAQLRRRAVQMYRAGIAAADVARKLKRSRGWVYKWVNHQKQHPWTRFRSGSRAPHHRANRLPDVSARRIVRIRQQLMCNRPRRLRFAPVGARSIQSEWRKRCPKQEPPSLSTIQRVLQRKRLTNGAARPSRSRYRPHPPATYPNAVQATDIITRWITGGEVVQTFNTVDVYSNDTYSTTHSSKTIRQVCWHLLHTWQHLGVPDLAQFDNESAFSGGRHARVLSRVVRLCLYLGIEVLFTPLGEASYNWPVETFNNLWAQLFWSRHQFKRRQDVPRVQRAFLKWYRTDYIAPRQPDTPLQMRRGYQLRYLSARSAARLPNPLPLCAGQVHTVRRVSETGYVSFLNQPVRVGKRHHKRYVWLTLETACQRLTIWYQARAEADWQWLKEFEYPLAEPIVPVPERFARWHV